jgi:hypothetical protein
MWEVVLVVVIEAYLSLLQIRQQVEGLHECYEPSSRNPTCWTCTVAKCVSKVLIGREEVLNI